MKLCMKAYHNFILGNLKKILIVSQDCLKKSSRGCGEDTFCLPIEAKQIFQNKIMEYAWAPSSTKQKQTPVKAARIPPWHHHRHFYTNYGTLTVLRQDSTANKGYL